MMEDLLHLKHLYTFESRGLVKKFVTEHLYPTDTPEFRVEVSTTWIADNVHSVLLVTDIPDGVIYRVDWNSTNNQATLTAYKKVEED